MFCPVCKDEYRAGFTRCATCDVDLVHAIAPAAEHPPKSPADAAVDYEPRLNFCGFMTLHEAQHARSTLRERGIQSEILIRSLSEHGESGDEEKDEYWLRLAAKDFRAAQSLLGYDLADTGTEGGVFCSSCGEVVAAEDNACPHCGEKFEEA